MDTLMDTLDTLLVTQIVVTVLLGQTPTSLPPLGFEGDGECHAVKSWKNAFCKSNISVAPKPVIEGKTIEKRLHW